MAQRARLHPSDACPCGSAIPLGVCCLREGGRLLPASAITAMPLGSHRNPRCYAAALEGCSTRISGEHAISNSVLKVFAEEGVIDIGGTTWMAEGERRLLPTPSLVANVLCTNHNAALAPLDALAGRLLGWLSGSNRLMHKERRRVPADVRLFNGHDIERWFIKALCGFVASGTIDMPASVVPKTWRPPMHWLHVLFGQVPQQSAWGLYFRGKPGDPSDPVSFSFAIMANDQIGPYGLSATLVGKQFLFAMATSEEGPESLLNDATYRPSEFVDTNGINKRLTVIGWDAPHPPTSVEMVHLNPRPGRSKGARRTSGAGRQL